MLIAMHTRIQNLHADPQMHVYPMHVYPMHHIVQELRMQDFQTHAPLEYARTSTSGVVSTVSLGMARVLATVSDIVKLSTEASPDSSAFTQRGATQGACEEWYVGEPAGARGKRRGETGV